jgi:glycosyltransferase involved in cell wall biosynthesis
MRRLTVLHYLTQWMWLSDSFVYGPIANSRHRAVAVSRLPRINQQAYPPPAQLLELTASADPPAEGAETAGRVTQLLEGGRPDVVHLHHGYGLPDAAALAKMLEVPLVVSFWGYDVTALPTREPERIVPYLTVPDVVLVPSRFLAGHVRALGVPPQRIHVMPGSVDTRFFAPTPLPPQPEVAFIGRFVAKKGIDTLLRAWRHVRDLIPAAGLTLLGYGDRPPTPDDARGVRVLAPDPADPRRQVRDVIRRCRVYVSPSKTGPDGDSESQHVGNLEAQASGRAVLTTNHGAIPEFVLDGVTGIVVPQDDHESLAAAMTALLRHDDRCRHLAGAASVAAQRFDVRRVAALHDGLYAKIGRAT